jgi:hypothetical protein
MKPRPLLFALLLLTQSAMAEPSPAAVAAFNSYVATVESRLAIQHRSPATFMAPVADQRLQRGDFVIEELATPSISGALLHHWRGTAFAPGATAANFERLMRDFSAYPQNFAPQVVQARLLGEHDGVVQASMRVRQKHIITVVMDTAYDIAFAQLDPRHGYSISRSTRIREVGSGGEAGSNEDHGFLWRQNTYWTWEERDGGLYLQIESVSLSRSIPRGLAWAVQPFVESVPRDSLEFTLRSTVNALERKSK